MKYTNKRGFPDFVVEWLKYDDYDYDENALSATTLMQPPRAYALKKQNWEDLEIDIEDLIASRYGTAVHDSVEKVGLTGCKQEERLRKTVKNRVITGKFDILKAVGNNQWQLIDVKSTSVWTYIYGSKDDDYRTQLSIYRWLALQNGYNVVGTGKVWFIFTDWSAAKAKQDHNYPQTRIIVKDFDLWTDDRVLNYIGERIDLFNSVLKQTQDQMPRCTDEELWASEDTWAIMKKGAKRAFKVHKSEAEAKAQLEGTNGAKMSKDYEIVMRKGMVKRCKYCAVRKFCTQYKELVAEGRSENYEI